jgi:serine/threonine-protein kinase
LRELGASTIPTWAALETLTDGRTMLVVVEQVTRGGHVDKGEIDDWIRVSQRLATLAHPNVARVREVVVREDEVVVITEFVDGVRWGELAAGPQPVSLEIALRILIDTLAGLSAIHNVRDAKREPLKLVHGGLTTACIVVGQDGVSRVVAASRVRTSTRPEHDGSAYLAPEVLLADDAADARADIYSIGVMLWEALTARPLFPSAQPSAILTALLSGRVPRAEAPKEAPWAAPLVDIASRALSVEPDKRFPSASAMAAELRRVAGVKLVPSLRVAALVRAGFGERIRTRREELERGEVVPRAPAPVRPPEAEVDLEGVSSSRPTPVPAPLVTTRPPPPQVEPTTTFDSVPVIMSSDPPTQPRGRPVDGSTEAPVIPANLGVPAAPAVPRELLDMADSAVAHPMPPEAPALSAPPLSHAPSVLPTGEAAVAPRKGGRALVYVAVASVILALGGLLAWLGLKGAAPGDIATAAASASIAAPPPPATRTAVDIPTAQAPAEPMPSATAAPTEPAAPSASPATGSPAAPPTPAMPAKPRAIKYDPQGI